VTIPVNYNSVTLIQFSKLRAVCYRHLWLCYLAPGCNNGMGRC